MSVEPTVARDGDACASRLPSFKVELKSAHISDTFLVDDHLVEEGGVALVPH